MFRIVFNRSISAVWATVAVCVLVSSAKGQGVILNGVGPVNRAMGSAGTAAPLEATSAVHWNPGSISALPQSEVSFGLELLSSDIDFTTVIGGGTNTTNGDSGFVSVPSVGWVHRLDDSRFTLGLGMYGIGGFTNNLPADPSSPVLATSPAYAAGEFLQIAPTLAYAVTDRLAIGAAPTITLGQLTLDPLGPSVVTPTATQGSGNRVHWGGGFQVGAYYIANPNWRFGVSYKSPQWFEQFRFFAPSGTIGFDLDYPAIISIGTALSCGDRWTIAMDVRYIDYENSDGFRELGFSSIGVFALGAQYRATDRVHLRAGYAVNGNPIHDDDAFTNIFTPLIQEENVSAGLSWSLTDNVDLNASYVYMVDNEVTGPLPASTFGPAATVTHRLLSHSAIFGVTARY